MAINIQNLVAAANAKIAAGASDAADSARLDTLATLVANHENALTFKSITDLPTADSSNAGLIFRVAPLVNGAYADSSSNFYLSYRGQWKPLSFTDSAVTVGQFVPAYIGGYVSGGSVDGTSFTNTIEKFSFTSDANATDVGDLTVGREYLAGQNSSTHGYGSGGSTQPVVNTIDKFSFSVDGNATDVGDLSVTRGYATGQSSTASGYISGGRNWQINTNYNNIDKFPFATDTNASDVGDLTAGRYLPAGQSSATHGYTSGGFNYYLSGYYNVIDKFSFSVDGNASDVGDLTIARRDTSGQNSENHGYTCGGRGPSVDFNTIDKFTFASDTNATDVGDLTGIRIGPSGQSSTDNGYSSGGDYQPAVPRYIDAIDKFPFASDTNATDVASLSVGRRFVTGQSSK